MCHFWCRQREATNSRMSKSKSDLQQTAETLDYWKLFQDLPDPYMVVAVDDPDFTIVAVNKARERLTGKSREESVGKPLFDVLPGISDTQGKAGIKEMRQYLRT